MSNKLFMGGVMIAGTIMAVSGAVDLGALVGSAPFDYANATEEERVEFLQSETKYIAKRVQRGVVNPSGVGWSASLWKTEHDARNNEVRFIVRFKGQMANNGESQKAVREFQKGLCASRMDGRLAGAGSRLIVKFVNSEGYSKRTIVVNDQTCGKFA